MKNVILPIKAGLAVMFAVAVAAIVATPALAQYTEVIHVSDLNNGYLDCVNHPWGQDYWHDAYQVVYKDAYIYCSVPTGYIYFSSKTPFY